MNEWSNLTCLRFREASKGDKNYVQFENGDDGCLSHIGMQSGGQIIILAGEDNNFIINIRVLLNICCND